MQQHFIKQDNPAEVELLEVLYYSNDFDDIISANNPEIAKDHNNITVIL